MGLSYPILLLCKCTALLALAEAMPRREAVPTETADPSECQSSKDCCDHRAACGGTRGFPGPPYHCVLPWDGVGKTVAEGCGAEPKGDCSVNKQDCEKGFFCNADTSEYGHCQSCKGVDCTSKFPDDRKPCCHTNTCKDYPPEIISAISDGQVSSCEEIVAAVAANGGSCTTDLGIYDDDLKGKSLADVCCTSCEVPENDPLTAACQKVETVCSQDLTQAASKCWGPEVSRAEVSATGNDLFQGGVAVDAPCPTLGDSSDPIKVHACIECLQEIFGDEYRTCSCCVFPLLMKLGLEKEVAKVAGAYFPCH